MYTVNTILKEGQEILDGRFVVHKRLGSGAFGEIYKGNKLLSYAVYYHLCSVVEKKKSGEFYAAKIVSINVISISELQKD